MNRLILSLLALGLLISPTIGSESQKPKPKKIVLIAGKKSHGPVGNGIHDYGWSVKLIKVMLDNSNVRDQIQVECHLDGWPKNPKTLEDADTILIISDGRDGDLYEEAPHLASPERVKFIGEQMKRGCGFLTFHFSTFAPEKYSKEMLDWCGGYFQWEQKGKRNWYSAITIKESEVNLATPAHPIARGLTPFKMKEEFYYNLRFKPKDNTLKSIWVVPDLQGREPDGRVVAWVREREDSGRGFGTTCGHFYANWEQENFRKLILNAIVWTAKGEVPEKGVEAKFYTHAQLDAALRNADKDGKAKADDQIIRVLMFAGNEAHKWHNWERTTPAIKELLERDPRIKVDVSFNIEDLATRRLQDYHVIVQNYVNWHDPKSLSDKSKKAFTEFIYNGGGLVVIHFANGAFHFSLPDAKASDWPEYRKIVRRVWNHEGKDKEKSSHDNFGKFTVDLTKLPHPITEGLKSFELVDELYFNQAGTEAIDPLITAKSKITQQNEPLAWTSTYGKGKVFQTLLGHSEKTYDVFEPREMLRRAVGWAAGRQIHYLSPEKDLIKKETSTPPSNHPLVLGKFGNSLNGSFRGALVSGKEEYRQFPITVECWAKLENSQVYNILVANELKSSATHWEIFAEAGNGCLTVYHPGFTPDHVRSKINICDKKWHHLGMTIALDRVRLFIDGKEVANQAVNFNNGKTVTGDFAIGSLVGREFGCPGLVDDVRISKGIREIKLTDKPHVVDDDTLSLWRFDKLENDTVQDVGKLKNPAKVSNSPLTSAPVQGPMPPQGIHLKPVDTRLKAILIDRSEKDAFMAMKVDSQGNLFVGARDSVFVFEPNAQGLYHPKKEICRFPSDSIIIGLEYRGNDLYVMTANALYLLPEGRTKREGIQPKRLVWGLPLDLHVSFHCLAWGPDGYLYFNHGDPLLNASDFNRPDHWGHWFYYCQPEGAKIPYTGTGAVLKVKPDGSDLQVIATGLRGPVGLAFDGQWNLFTNENDHESIPDRYAPAKLLHVTPHIDFAWPRGWMASKSPDRFDLIEPMIASLGRGVPCDQIVYDEPFLPSELRNSVLMARWDRLTVNKYPLRQRGASFESEEESFLIGDHLSRPVGITVGRGGRIFVSSLYLTSNVWSPHCPSDIVMITKADDSKNHPFESFNLTQLTPKLLWVELSSSSLERRQRAHIEILRRGGDFISEATNRLKTIQEDDPAIWHLPWIAASGQSDTIPDTIRKLLTHSKNDVRALALRILAGPLKDRIDPKQFQKHLSDADPRIQLAGLHGYFGIEAKVPVEDVIPLAVSSDTYLRQTALKLLAQKLTVSECRRLTESKQVKERLAGVVVVGLKLTVPGMHEIPPKELPLEYTHGNAQFKLKYADKEIDLKSLDRIGSYTTAVRWKALPHSADQMQLVDYLLQRANDAEDSVRLQSIYYLSLLRDPKIEPTVQKVRKEIEMKRMNALPQHSIAKVWMVGPFLDGNLGFKQIHPPESSVIDLNAEFAVGKEKRSWQIVESKEERFPISTDAGSKSSYLTFRLQSASRQPGALVISAPEAFKVWLNSRVIGEGKGSATLSLDLQPGSNDLLVRIQHGKDKPAIMLKYRSPSTVAATIPEKLDSSLLVERLKASGSNTGDKIPEEFLRVDWLQEGKKGDPIEGRKLFGSLACAKCHAITAEQIGGGAPSLAEAKKRFTIPHLVESVLLPSKQIADPFRASRIITLDGQTLIGLIVNETPETIELLQLDATRKFIRKDNIESRKFTESSPMPSSLVKTPKELRDLIAYLMSDNPLPP